MENATFHGIDSVKRQGRALKKTYFLLGTALMVTSISLAAFISLSHTMVTEPDIRASSSKTELDFNTIDKSAPIPLLTSTQKNDTESVKVLGAEVTNANSGDIETSPPATLLRETYVRSFTFVQTQESDNLSTVTASWNSRKSSFPQLYIVSRATGLAPSNNDIEIYSVQGDDLEVSSHTFQIDNSEGKLYLRIFELSEAGEYILKDTSLVVESSS